jgi:hypothetical protein
MAAIPGACSMPTTKASDQPGDDTLLSHAEGVGQPEDRTVVPADRRTHEQLLSELGQTVHPPLGGIRIDEPAA